MNQKYVDFALEKYKSVTREINTVMAEIFELEKYSILVFGAIYVFLFKDMCKEELSLYPKIFVALHMVTTFIFGLLIFSRYLRAKLLAGYIKSRYETNFL